MAKKWQKKEITTLEEAAGSKSAEELAEELGRDAADVRGKLQELGLAPSSSGATWFGDPEVAEYGKAMELVRSGKWQEAKKKLTALLDGLDLPEVAASARQMLRVCEVKLDGADAEAEDPFLEAVYLKNRGDLKAALDITTKGGRQSKDERFAYLAASLYALQGKARDAIATLEKAIELNPKNRVYAYHDPDFEDLLERPEAEQIFAAS